jgi:hypothetical protein
MAEENNPAPEEKSLISYAIEPDVNYFRFYTLFGLLAAGLILLVVWIFARMPGIEGSIGKPKPPPPRIQTAPPAVLPLPEIQPPAPKLTPPSAPIITPLTPDAKEKAPSYRKTENMKQ